MDHGESYRSTEDVLNARRYLTLRDMLIDGNFSKFFAQAMQAEYFTTETFDALIDSVGEKK